MRKYMMAGNWKMNKTIPEAIALTQQLCNYYNRAWDKVEVVLCVPAIDIRPVQTVIDFDKTDIEVAAQNVYFEPSGAYTGEISIPMRVAPTASSVIQSVVNTSLKPMKR